MFDTATRDLVRELDLVLPGDLVLYHGSFTALHGLYLAVPCDCRRCCHIGAADVRYRLTDPWGDPHRSALRCARRESLTRSTANA